MKRRDVVKLGAAALAAATAAPTPAAAGSAECAPSPVSRDAIADTVFYIPGYWPQSVYFGGVPAIRHKYLARAIPDGYYGSIKMLTRLAANGTVKQALFPVGGHDVVISPDGQVGFFGALERQDYVSFDPQTLDLVAMGKPCASGWMGGGHGVFIEDGRLLAISERAPKNPYSGQPGSHYGRITLRDPRTLEIVESYSSYGIAPHDICLLPDGRHLAVANYGSVVPKDHDDYAIPRKVVESSVAVIDLADGKLVDKQTTGTGRVETRHLTALSVDRIFAIKVEMAAVDEDQRHLKDHQYAYETDFTTSDEHCYLPTPLIEIRNNISGIKEIGSGAELGFMRQGIGIRHDEHHGEVLVTFPSSHSLFVIDIATSEIKQRIDTAAIGLDYPCGVSLIPGSPFYAVSGYWKNLFIFRRGSHEPVRDLCHYTSFFGHSHMTAVRTA